MQIDFHHAVTYIVARVAGFGHREAETVAYCSQYVDDATNSGTITFDNGAMYTRISSAHKMLDYRNFEKLANHHVWIPFHFLPGNGGMKAGENPGRSFINKIICRPNSFVARDMVRACIEDRNSLYGLHRLGVTMHVFADTWAHQGFAGVNHEVNDVRALDDHDKPDSGFMGRLKDFFGDKFDEVASKFVGDNLPLGHGSALSYPDRPYLAWSYMDHLGKRIVRDNSSLFLEAAAEMCKAMQQYRAGDPDANVPGMPNEISDKLMNLFRAIREDSGEERHKRWLNAINTDYFEFPPVKLEYRAKSAGSWKHQAIGARRNRDKKSDIFKYSPSFLSSDWKMFHDAIQAHRFTVIYDILPRYGICAA